ncbi:hypothetical protein [Desulfogranum marinum]|uniref:hypothetical protein n=1 Tax=Desulfogranum marinum TaxID=453220 RepID=UPI0029C6DA5E|nr:hypothetical protein [Desulfogranum marinum]
MKIGFCITSHGFGHAARAVAVMQALAKRESVEFVIATTVPKWFFSQSLEAPFIYHSILTDIGMVQLTGLEENIPATAAALDTFYPLTRSKIEACAAFFSQCRMVICDIAPLGILAAKQAKIPSILVENFTWDWIYAAYEQKSASLRSHIDYLDHLFQQADFHVQTEPVCLSIGCDCRVPPVARSIKASAPALRSRFSQGSDKLVLVTMGGTNRDSFSSVGVRAKKGYSFVVTGNEGPTINDGNICYLDRCSSVYHPDLVAAADIVVGKVGYSTLAEVYQAGSVFAYISRPYFPEAEVLCKFAAEHMASKQITREAFYSGRWAEELDDLIALKGQAFFPVQENGAEHIADFLLRLA